MTYGTRLQKALALRKKDRPWLAAQLGISVQAIGSVLSGHTRALKAENHEMAAAALHVNGLWLATGIGDMTAGKQGNATAITARQVPLLGRIPAGYFSPTHAPEVPEETILCPVRCSPRTYALRIDGLSMYAPGQTDSFSPGDIVFIDPDLDPVHGDFVAVWLDDSGDATFKRLLIEGGQRMIEAINPAWPDRIIRINGNATFAGVYIGKWSGSRRRG